MKVGFSILTHKEPDRMFESLVDQLNKFSDKHVAIHHDFNQSEFNNGLLINKNFELIKEYTKTSWSHVNNIHAILNTFKALHIAKCDWYITLSGNCYPIKPSNHICKFLEESRYDGFIEHHDVEGDFHDFYKYFRKALNSKFIVSVPFFKRNGMIAQKSIRIPRRKSEKYFHKPNKPYHGSDWFMINNKIVEYLLSKEEDITHMVSHLKEVNRAPDLNICASEFIFHSIIANAGRFNLNQDNYRYIDWSNSTDWHPNTLTMKDLPAIEASSALFARKLNWDNSKELIAHLNNQIL